MPPSHKLSRRIKLMRGNIISLTICVTLLVPASNVFAMNVWDLFDTDLTPIPIGSAGTWVEVNANTGGNSANGGTVRTGDASASVEVRTNGSISSSTSSVHVETVVIGVASSSDFTGAPGVPIVVDVKTSSATPSSEIIENITSSTTRTNIISDVYTGRTQANAVRLTIRERMQASIARITKYVEKIFTRFWN